MNSSAHYDALVKTGYCKLELSTCPNKNGSVFVIGCHCPLIYCHIYGMTLDGVWIGNWIY
jgi:hypothetical protein